MDALQYVRLSLDLNVPLLSLLHQLVTQSVETERKHQMNNVKIVILLMEMDAVSFAKSNQILTATHKEQFATFVEIRKEEFRNHVTTSTEMMEKDVHLTACQFFLLGFASEDQKTVQTSVPQSMVMES